MSCVHGTARRPLAARQKLERIFRPPPPVAGPFLARGSAARTFTCHSPLVVDVCANPPRPPDHRPPAPIASASILIVVALVVERFIGTMT